MVRICGRLQRDWKLSTSDVSHSDDPILGNPVSRIQSIEESGIPLTIGIPIPSSTARIPETNTWNLESTARNPESEPVLDGQHSLTSVERSLDTLWSLHKVD